MKKVGLISLGCAKNRVDSENMLGMLRQRGYAVQGADNQVLTGIRAVAELLQRDVLRFDTRCTNTRREFLCYVWEEDSGGQDRPVKENDHCMDALRYFVTTVLKRGQARVARKPRGL